MESTVSFIKGRREYARKKIYIKVQQSATYEVTSVWADLDDSDFKFGFQLFLNLNFVVKIQSVQSRLDNLNVFDYSTIKVY